MNRYHVEVTEQVTYCLTVDAETAQEAIQAAQRHEGQVMQASAPKWLFGAPERLNDD